MEAHIYDIASNAGRVLLNPFLVTVPVVGLLVLVTGFAGRVAISIEDLRYVSMRRSHTPRPPEAQPAPSLGHRAEGATTGQERIEPGGIRQDETARRLHLVHETLQVIDVSGFRVDPTAVEKIPNRRPEMARATAV